MNYEFSQRIGGDEKWYIMFKVFPEWGSSGWLDEPGYKVYYVMQDGIASQSCWTNDNTGWYDSPVEAAKALELYLENNK